MCGCGHHNFRVWDIFGGLGKGVALLLHGLEQDLDKLFAVEVKVGVGQGVVPIKSKEIHQERVDIDAAKSEEVKSSPYGAHIGSERLASLHLEAEEFTKGGEEDEAIGGGKGFAELGDHFKAPVNKIRTGSKEGRHRAGDGCINGAVERRCWLLL